MQLIWNKISRSVEVQEEQRQVSR